MVRAPPEERDLGSLVEFGVVNLDKPPGPSAHQVSAWVRDLVGVEKAAHAGTLDPKVTGCLPVLTGTATRLAPAFLEGEKEYVAVLELHGPAPADIEAVIGEFEGDLYQKPPRKSAVSRRLRVRTIYELDLLEVQERKALLKIRCESGTYVRKLCHDLGLALGTGAHMGHLRRTATTPFDDASLCSLYDLADAIAFAEEGDEAPLRDLLEPGERALAHLPRVTVAPSAAHEIAHGAQVYAPGVIDAEGDPDDEPLVACYTPEGSAVCLGRLVGDPAAETGRVVALERVLV
ncbi:RNA-guided pseudouridylation complex pseudouridine synthase subunit Cbf5 [Halalkalicoccus jeotgali]|uniref:Probable tRNA pseudouridine synthase B n=1 Tax=Halalkalicoccus jeotgali (strain DSM 18796 / CECT 7217 / JCM 14584 / KCTC 4019 / B3) TaxID=795797 RepID=D8JA18_HALJB|nr:RNA-guided pseudouridylation complex pseudouridine synthase subunit Cbf5 [Halalkalicoccus jeotgali]ADJ14540.1 H/ACA RNA-protein complex component Cbf5p [Halalkalicoccus jeotgali B3]ELY40112.1 H/ACA RNA-protein complex component Cbf5p [Halalkalicoccus jeotgali B3]